MQIEYSIFVLPRSPSGATGFQILFRARRRDAAQQALLDFPALGCIELFEKVDLATDGCRYRHSVTIENSISRYRRHPRPRSENAHEIERVGRRQAEPARFVGQFALLAQGRNRFGKGELLTGERGPTM